MRLVYIQNMRLPTEKAHGYQIMKTCEALAHSGASVGLHVPNRKTPILQDAFSYYDVERIFEIKRHPVMDWIGMVPTPLKPLAFFFERISFIKSLKKSLPSNADVYFTRDPWLAVKLTRLTKDIPVYLELHALPNKRTIRNLSTLSGMLCVTKWMQSEIKHILPKLRTYFLPDAVDLATFDPPITRAQAREELHIPQNIKMVVYGGKFSTMEKSKGLALLDHAVADLTQEFPDLQLFLVGGSEDEFRGLENADPAKSTTCIAHVDRKKLAKYYRAADLLVLPFPNTHHYAFEMSPLKLFEYMVSGTPILTSDLPSIREILDENSATFFRAENIESLTNALRVFLNDAEKANRLADSAYNLGRRFTWDNRANEILSFVQRV